MARLVLVDVDVELRKSGPVFSSGLVLHRSGNGPWVLLLGGQVIGQVEKLGATFVPGAWPGVEPSEEIAGSLVYSTQAAAALGNLADHMRAVAGPPSAPSPNPAAGSTAAAEEPREETPREWFQRIMRVAD